MIIVPFEPWHIKAMKGREFENSLISLYKDNLDYLLYNYANFGIAYTGIVDDKIIGSGGVLKLWDGVGEAWVFSSIYFEENKRQVYTQVKKFLQLIIDNADYHRIQASIKCDYDVAVRFIEKLGFEREGLMKKYGMDKSDYYRYSRVK